MSRAVNKRLSEVKKRFGRFSVLTGFGLDFGSNTNRTKKVNTDDLYYNKFHTQVLFTAADLT